MGERTAIEWTDHTMNFWIGCTKVGPGCDFCYAEAGDARFNPDPADRHWGPGAPRRRTSPQYWRQPLKWNRRAAEQGQRRKVFCCSWADFFDNEIDPQWRRDAWGVIRATPNLDWQIVTKRIGNAPDMLPEDWGVGWSNVWLIATIVNQQEADRDPPKLLDIPAAIHGVSYEPALGPVDWRPWIRRGLKWIIWGGESDAQRNGTARPFDIQWARDTITAGRECGAAVYGKQLGARPYKGRGPDGFSGDEPIDVLGLDVIQPMRLRDRKGADPAEWPSDIRVREFPQCP